MKKSGINILEVRFDLIVDYKKHLFQYRPSLRIKFDLNELGSKVSGQQQQNWMDTCAQKFSLEKIEIR